MPIRSAFALLVIAAAVGACARAQPQTPAPARAAPRPPRQQEEGIKPYRQVVPDTAKTDSGVFQVHRVGEKLLYEIPNAMLEREFLLVTRIARTHANIGYGGEQENEQVVRWQRQGVKILLRVVSYVSVADSAKPIYEAVRNANFEPIVGAFDIAAYNGDTSAVVIDVSALFTTDVPLLGLDQRRRREYQVRRLDRDRSYVVRTASYPRNVEVRHVLTYEAQDPPANGSTGAISVEMAQSMVLLPEHPMTPRLWDERVGFFRVQQTDYGMDAQRAETRRYITRWRLEPSDTAAFLRGELVEPVQPIIYYIDPATPLNWRPWIQRGVEDWNAAFEAAGFRNAIRAMDPPTPEEDPEFSPEDARYSVIRYFPSAVQNAYGPHVSDPRTGEILESDIGWFHNVMNLLRNWYFVQTAAANPEARGVQFGDSVMGELIRFVSAHEVGHTLGLPHNMKASASYPVDSLRAPGFVCRMGTAPSIMDYARFNYVAQPDDAGACFLPRIGPYDVHAIRWGYRPILEAAAPDDEVPVLDAWVRADYDNPVYHYGDPSGVDPTSQTEAIGDDPVRASELGIENLKRLIPNLRTWTYVPHADYEQLEELYGQVLGQWNRYMGHVATMVGGVTRTRKNVEQAGPVYDPVPRADQQRAMRFFAEQAFATPQWMLDREILARVEHAGAVERVRTFQVRVLNNLLDPRRLQRLIETEALYGSDAYSLGAMLTDLRRGVWTELGAARPIDTFRRNLQRGYLERMAYLMTEEPPAVNVPPQFRRFREITDVNVSQSDIRPFARGELETLQREIRGALGRTSDRATRLHLQDALVRIERTLDPER